VLGALDVALLRAFRTRGHTRSRERAVAAFSRLGEQAFLWFAVCAVGALADPGNRPVYKRAARTVLGSYACNQLIKVAVRRRRPRLPDLPPLAGTLSGLSYPSAHAATSFAGARMLSPALPAAPLYATAVGLGLSRLYLGLHYPTDIVAGAALGASIAELRS
jgi:decaprenylphosphoryl-5-phosphoribose phosphatase